VTLPQRLYHSFWGEGKVLVGEVSKINDDHTDNRFYESIQDFRKLKRTNRFIILNWRLSMHSIDKTKKPRYAAIAAGLVCLDIIPGMQNIEGSILTANFYPEVD
jgi:hypothetical protein